MESNTSPVPEKAIVTHSFLEAMEQVIGGKRITRLDWPSEDEYGQLVDGRLKIHRADGQVYDWIISEGDLLANDWVVTD